MKRGSLKNNNLFFGFRFGLKIRATRPIEGKTHTGKGN